ncbi:4274_t:CDS:2, partial [Rhizophagus irregularis]
MLEREPPASLPTNSLRESPKVVLSLCNQRWAVWLQLERRSLYWQDFIKCNPMKSITCESIENDVPFRFQVFSKYRKNDPLV